MKLRTTTINQTVTLPGSPREVYDCLIDQKKHSDFTGAKATCNPKAGGSFTAWDGYIRGRNVILEEGRRIVQEWITTEWPEGYPPSTVEFKLKPTKTGTELTMTHTNVPSEQAEDYRIGWIEFYWNPLKQYLAR
jgi:activator of HSP90 ATPase